ncbi:MULTISPECIES: DUF1707 SHOCT-like domain-containing protein [Mycolicibacterium]|uniref:DUF1707 domain-containing protein n=2 Tax=Mycolicibacterium gilvum TaxID=1804 RepID=E6TAX8_MYCSR|nr:MULTISPECIES: DUF1707 domain-containing protein [Mycolicibacterium]ABP43353.1 protein of unknown function DUF1707 [Mycolicibacterium gilvum PYR-GCK]ADU01830.1 protein of unknown function (DUF1707) [Mycolicibacterium gilvum Spyr1]MBV5246282.1 DUF1707 domain-containing protein [Mycolicibacterium sp. PAM1]
MASGGSGRRTSSGRRTAWTRAKDSDRNETCQILDTALADGQLSMTEHGERVKSATTASTLGQLQDLVSDLQTAKTIAEPTVITRVINRQVARPGWGVKAAIAAVLVVLGIAIGWGLYGNSSSPLSFQTDPGAKDDGIPARVLTPPRQLQSLGGFTGLFEQMRQKFGSTMGYELDIHSDMAYLDRPDPQDNRRSLTYYYRGGWGEPSGSPTAVSADERLVDLAKFDFEKILGVVRGAPETVGISRADLKETWLRISPSEDPATPDAVIVEIVVNSDFGNGRIELYPDGTPLAIWPANR